MCSVPRSLGGPAGNCRLYLETEPKSGRLILALSDPALNLTLKFGKF